MGPLHPCPPGSPPPRQSLYDGGTNPSPNPSWAPRSLRPRQGAWRLVQHQRDDHLRGNPQDYDRWAARPGLEHWSHAHCLPYFKRAESRLQPDEYHGGDGPLHLETGPCTNPLFEAFFAAAEQAGHARLTDLNGFRQEGVAPFDRNIQNGRRLSAARAYLHPVLSRPNLQVRTLARATRILFEGRRAVGVEYRHMGFRRTVRAGRVICCGGAIGTPQLLLVSGVGPADHLSQHVLTSWQKFPAWESTCRTTWVTSSMLHPAGLCARLKWTHKPFVGLEWLWSKTGPAATNHFEGGGFLRSNQAAQWPNVQMHFLPLAIRYDGSMPNTAHGYQVHAGPMLSNARGTLRLKSADPGMHPALRFNYLSTEQDRREWVETIRAVRHILSQPALHPFDGGELSPGPDVQTDEQILDWVARDAETALHPAAPVEWETSPTRWSTRARWPSVTPKACLWSMCPSHAHQREHLRPDDAGRYEPI